MNRARSEEYAEAKRIERNRKACPTAVKVVDILFDLAAKYPAIEDLAIQVDAVTIQFGREIDSDMYANVLREAARRMEPFFCERCKRSFPKPAGDGNLPVALDEKSGQRVCEECL